MIDILREKQKRNHPKLDVEMLGANFPVAEAKSIRRFAADIDCTLSHLIRTGVRLAIAEAHKERKP